MESRLDREGVERRKANRLARKTSGNKILAVSMELRSNGGKITAKGNYTQEVLCSEVHDVDGAVLSKHVILVGET